MKLTTTKVSEKKLESNRKNAQRSTGPKTAVGKARSAGNAIRHGMFAEHFLLAGESEEDFARLIESLKEQYPDGDAITGELVMMLATMLWRYWRILRWHKAAAERETLNRAVERFGTNSPEWVQEDGTILELMLHDPEKAERILKSHAGTARTIADELRQNARVSDKSRELLLTLPLPVGMDVLIHLNMIEKARMYNFDEDPQTSEELIKISVRDLDNFTTTFENFRNMVLDAKADASTKLASRLANLANLDELERVTRFETALVRQIHRLIALLEARKGGLAAIPNGT